MKRTVKFTFLLVIPIFLLLLTTKKASAIVKCDQSTKVPCTACVFDGVSCPVRASQSSCTDHGYYDNDAGCEKLGDICQNYEAATVYIDCVENSNCTSSGGTCNVADGQQGSCCNGLLCYGKKCSTPPTNCGSLNQSCTPATDSQGNCCSGYICRAGSAVCSTPLPTPIGYWCDTESIKYCEPCYSSTTSKYCNPVQYSDWNSCMLGCSGQPVEKHYYTCIIGKGCEESENGEYSSADECSASCNKGNIFNDVTCDNKTGIKTAIGCLHILKDNSNSTISEIIKFGIGIGGGIAFLLMIYAGFMIMTASGNPERLKAGQELITSAIAGIILLIFSIFILKFIGIDILGLCKFGFGKC